MNGYYWQPLASPNPVAGPFDTPKEAGEWRRDHPPLIDIGGPTLRLYREGRRVIPVPASDLLEAHKQFCGAEEPRNYQLELNLERRAA